MSPTYAFVGGAILLALGVLRIVWFLWRGSATREARLFGVGAARFMYFGGGALLLVCGMCFWGWAAMVFFDQRTPRPGPKAGQAYTIPNPMARPGASDASLTDAVELEPGYWIRPPRGFNAEPVTDTEENGHLHRVYCWRHAEDAQRFVAFMFTLDDSPCESLSAVTPIGDSTRGQFLVEHFHERLRELGGPTLTPEGEIHLANYDGLLAFGKRTRHSQAQYGAAYYAGCSDGFLIELICCEKGHSGLESSLRSLERRETNAEKF